MQAIKPPETDELLLAIYQAILENPTADGIHLSIEPHGREMKNPDGTVSYMKALCWNLTIGGEYLSEDDPHLAVVCEDHNDESIRADLDQYFAGYAILVDHDILIEEED